MFKTLWDRVRCNCSAAAVRPHLRNGVWCTRLRNSDCKAAMHSYAIARLLCNSTTTPQVHDNSEIACGARGAPWPRQAQLQCRSSIDRGAARAVAVLRYHGCSAVAVLQLAAAEQLQCCNLLLQYIVAVLQLAAAVHCCSAATSCCSAVAVLQLKDTTSGAASGAIESAMLQQRYCSSTRACAQTWVP